MSARARASYFEAAKPRVEVIPMIDIMMFLLVFFVVISLRMIAGTGVPMEIPSSKTTQSIKSSTVTVGIIKTGETVIDGKPFDWSRGDIVALPSWAQHAHENTGGEDAILFSISDRPVIEALGFYREEIA